MRSHITQRHFITRYEEISTLVSIEPKWLQTEQMFTEWPKNAVTGVAEGLKQQEAEHGDSGVQQGGRNSCLCSDHGETVGSGHSGLLLWIFVRIKLNCSY